MAEEMYKKAIDVDPKYLPPYANLGFLFEKKGDITNATYYWKQRYLLGKQGEYWRQKAREHLIKLGTFPAARKEELAEEANVFSHNILVERENKRKQAIAQSQQHLSLGTKAMAQGRYIEAEMQFSAILQLMPEDEELLFQAKEQYRIAKDYATRQRIKQHLEKAAHQLDSKIRDDKDYIYALEELEKAQELIPESARQYEYADQ
jgi:Flp pilus assembly protein TadD